MLTSLAILSIVVIASGNSLTGSFQQCNLQCTNDGDVSSTTPPASTLLRGKSGPRGEKGEVGLPGLPGVKGEPGVSFNETVIEQLQRRITKLELERDVISSVMPFKNCQEILDSNPLSTDGVYTIQINSSTSIDVLCDMSGGGWTVFQNRFDGSENFNRNFNEYSIGFGGANHEHWLGLSNIHQLTSQSGIWTLRVELETFQGETAYAQYADFSVGEGTDYILLLGEYSGTAGNSMGNHGGSKFSTPDRDQDTWRPGFNCARTYTGAWWYKSCLNSNLNSFKYGDESVLPIASAFGWYYFKDKWIPLKSSQMKAMITNR